MRCAAPSWVLALLAALVCLGCEGPSERLHGSWRLDLEAVAADPRLDGLEARERDVALALVRGMYADTRWTFGEGRLTRRDGGRIEVTPYEVSRAAGDVVVLRLGPRTLRVEARERGLVIEEDGHRLPLRRTATGP